MSSEFMLECGSGVNSEGACNGFWCGFETCAEQYMQIRSFFLYFIYYSSTERCIQFLYMIKNGIE